MIRSVTVLWLLACLFNCRVVRADVFHVPTDFPTIQQGLDALSSGDTVLVADGEYAEALIAPPILFWVLGDVEIDTGDFSRPIIDASLTPDSVIRGCLLLSAGSVAKVERVRFRNRFDMVQRGVWGGVRLESDSAAFSVCSFDSCFGAVTQSPDGSPGHVVLDRCVFRDYRSYVSLFYCNVSAADCDFSNVRGTWIVRCGDGSVIENCRFTDAIGNCVSSYFHRDVTIRGCAFGPFDTTNTIGILDLEGFNGVVQNNLFTQIQSYWNFVELSADSLLGASISSNTFYDCKYAGAGTGGQLLDVHSAAQTIPVPAPYVVEYNVMAACTLGDWAIAIHAKDRGVFRRNRLYDLEPSPVMGAPAVYVDSVVGIIFRDNIFYDNHVSMHAQSGNPVDAHYNWWGDSTGPYHAALNPGGQGDTIVGNVDFVPWYPDTSFLSIPGIGKPLPEQFLLEAYPNPFNSTVTLRFIPPEAMIVRVELFDILGRRVKEIWSGPIAFQKQITFDASDLTSGIYFARVWQPIGNRQLALSKLVLMK